MGQVTLFFLFIIMLVVGTFAYFSPQRQAANYLKTAVDAGDYDTGDESNVKKSRQLNMATNAGIVQIQAQADDITQEQKHLIGMIDYEQQVLNITNKEIADLGGQGNTLRLKALELELRNYQNLLSVNDQQLIALNDQISRNRQSLAEEREVVNINTTSQSAAFFDKVRQEVDDERQKTQDQQNRL